MPKTLQTQRTILFDQYEGKCFYCGWPLDRFAFTIDHKIPRAKGGSNDIENKVPACLFCNNSKGDMSLEEWKEELALEKKHQQEKIRKIEDIISRL